LRTWPGFYRLRPTSFTHRAQGEGRSSVVNAGAGKPVSKSEISAGSCSDLATAPAFTARQAGEGDGAESIGEKTSALALAATIELDEEKEPARESCPVDNLALDGIDLKGGHVRWDVCMAQWIRTRPGGSGVVTFWFPLMVFGPSYKPQKVLAAANIFPLAEHLYTSLTTPLSFLVAEKAAKK